MAAHGQHWRQDNPPVCPEPKVFVGQIPFESTTADVQALFSKYGTIRSCLVITGPDGRSKGCAMILYATWTEAEQAVEAENSTTHLGGSKPMVVKFADPPRRGDGPIVGIAPKKLFVGQIPSTMTDELLRAMFTPYGNVLEVHLLKKSVGSGCGFVTYDRWSSCEAAINALHGKTHLEGAKMPMVVKFADAKVPTIDNGYGMVGPAGKRGYDSSNILGAAAVAGAMAGAAVKKAYTGMGTGAFPYAVGGYGMPGMGPMGAMPGMGGYGMGIMGMGGMGMGLGMGLGMQPGMGMRPPMAGIPGGKLGVGNPAMQASKLGSGIVDETAKQWKLFIGQVPFEASEADLWNVFSTVGNILELVILRTPHGKSKGCAFVTYETRAMAEKAIRQFDGQVALQDDPKQRLLIVKYAGTGGAVSPGTSAAALGSGPGAAGGATGGGAGSTSGGGPSTTGAPSTGDATPGGGMTGGGSTGSFQGQGYEGPAGAGVASAPPAAVPSAAPQPGTAPTGPYVQPAQPELYAAQVTQMQAVQAQQVAAVQQQQHAAAAAAAAAAAGVNPPGQQPGLYPGGPSGLPPAPGGGAPPGSLPPMPPMGMVIQPGMGAHMGGMQMGF